MTLTVESPSDWLTRPVSVKLGQWTLRIHPGRKAGSLPAEAPAVTLYQGYYDERKNIEMAIDRLTPWDHDFAEKLRAALIEADV